MLLQTTHPERRARAAPRGRSDCAPGEPRAAADRSARPCAAWSRSRARSGTTRSSRPLSACSSALGAADAAAEQAFAQLAARKARTPAGRRLASRPCAQSWRPATRAPSPTCSCSSAPTIAEALGPNLGSCGVGRRDKIDPRSGLALRNEIAAWAGAFGIQRVRPLRRRQGAARRPGHPGRDARARRRAEHQGPAVADDPRARRAGARRHGARDDRRALARRRDHRGHRGGCLPASPRSASTTRRTPCWPRSSGSSARPSRARRARPWPNRAAPSSRRAPSRAPGPSGRSRRTIGSPSSRAATRAVVLCDVLGVPIERLGQAIVGNARAEELLRFVLVSAVPAAAALVWSSRAHDRRQEGARRSRRGGLGLRALGLGQELRPGGREGRRHRQARGARRARPSRDRSIARRRSRPRSRRRRRRRPRPVVSLSSTTKTRRTGRRSSAPFPASSCGAMDPRQRRVLVRSRGRPADPTRDGSRGRARSVLLARRTARRRRPRRGDTRRARRDREASSTTDIVTSAAGRPAARRSAPAWARSGAPPACEGRRGRRRRDVRPVLRASTRAAHDPRRERDRPSSSTNPPSSERARQRPRRAGSARRSSSRPSGNTIPRTTRSSARGADILAGAVRRARLAKRKVATVPPPLPASRRARARRILGPARGAPRAHLGGRATRRATGWTSRRARRCASARRGSKKRLGRCRTRSARGRGLLACSEMLATMRGARSGGGPRARGARLSLLRWRWRIDRHAR